MLVLYAGDGVLKADNSFSTLDQMPATVFGLPYYEFCIKAELMELAGIEFTKPLTPHDVEPEQEIYIVMPTRILRTKFDEENSEILCSVMNGFAQADAENAILQLKAIGSTFGQVIGDVEIKDGFNDKPKRQRNKRVNAELSEVKPIESEPPSLLVQIQTASDLTTLDALEIDVSGRDPLIQPKLMGALKKRRFELENAASSEPDYLLEV